MDPALVRVGWVVLALLTGGLLLVLYVVMAFVVPLRPDTEGPAYSVGTSSTPPAAPGSGPETWPSRPAAGRADHDNSGPIVLGAILILVGGFFLLRQFIPALNPELLWPVLVIIGGVLLIAAAVGRRR